MYSGILTLIFADASTYKILTPVKKQAAEQHIAASMCRALSSETGTDLNLVAILILGLVDQRKIHWAVVGLRSRLRVIRCSHGIKKRNMHIKYPEQPGTL